MKKLGKGSCHLSLVTLFLYQLLGTYTLEGPVCILSVLPLPVIFHKHCRLGQNVLGNSGLCSITASSYFVKTIFFNS